MVKALVYVVPLALALYCLFDLMRSDVADRGGLHPLAWAAVIVLLPVVGPITWLVLSRGRRPSGRIVGGPSVLPRRPRPGVAPDDDPEFLWRLDQQRRRAGPTPGVTPPPPEGDASGAPAQADDDPAT